MGGGDEVIARILARLDLARHRWAERHLNPACQWAEVTHEPMEGEK